LFNRTKYAAQIIVARQVDGSHAAAADLADDLVPRVKNSPFRKWFELCRLPPVSIVLAHSRRRLLTDLFTFGRLFLCRGRSFLCRLGCEVPGYAQHRVNIILNVRYFAL